MNSLYNLSERIGKLSQYLEDNIIDKYDFKFYEN